MKSSSDYPTPPLVLASSSPRRREMLQELGVQFEVMPAHIDETPLPGELPLAMVERLAREKSAAVAGQRTEQFVLAADTTVALGARSLGKPASPDEARAMLRHLSGREHEVLGAFCLVRRAQGVEELRVSVTRVTFLDLTEAMIDNYVATGEPFDKAGGYGIQGQAASFVREVHGSYTNIVGLDLAAVSAVLRKYRVLP